MNKPTEKKLMLAGKLYHPQAPELIELRKPARRLMHQLNQTSIDELDQRNKIIRQLFGCIGPTFEIEPPFYCDYGCHIFAGDRFYMNFGCVILDCNEVHIGDDVLVAPYVQIYTPHHPIDPEARTSGRELALPVHIGNKVWLGGGAIVCPGVTIGDNTTIGAGSVVTGDIPANVVAAGNPCRVIRNLSDEKQV